MLLRIVSSGQKYDGKTPIKDQLDDPPTGEGLRIVFYDQDYGAYWWDEDYPCLPPLGASILPPADELEFTVVDGYIFQSEGFIRVFCETE